MDKRRGIDMTLIAESTVLDDAKLNEDISEVSEIATATAQNFWFKESGTDAGAHISELKQTDFETNPSGGNLLANSNGIAVRDGLDELAVFGMNGARIGQSTSGNALIESNKIALRNGSTEYFYVQGGSGTVVFSKILGASLTKATYLRGEIKTGRTIDVLEEAVLHYTFNGTAKTRTFTSFPVSVSDTEFFQLEIGYDPSSIGYIITGNNTNDIIVLQDMVITYTTDDIVPEMVAGAFSDETYTTAMRVGNGTSSSAKSNAFGLDWDGTAHFNGDVFAFCNSDSSGGISLGEFKHLGTLYYYYRGSQATSEDEVTITGYRCGRVVQLFITVALSTNVGAGADIVSGLSLANTAIPAPMAPVGGVMYYGNHTLIAQLYKDTVWKLTVRNVATTSIPTLGQPTISITYLTNE